MTGVQKFTGEKKPKIKMRWLVAKVGVGLRDFEVYADFGDEGAALRCAKRMATGSAHYIVFKGYVGRREGMQPENTRGV